MCMDDYFGLRRIFWDCRVLATDISRNALLTAKNGVFSEQSLKELPKDWIQKYFVRLENGTYKVTDNIRNNVIFKYHNLIEPIEYKKKFDLILCRNVMIYFDEATKENLIDRFYDVTEDGGYLYIGHAEMIPKHTKYTLVAPAIYRKIPDKNGGEF